MMEAEAEKPEGVWSPLVVTAAMLAIGFICGQELVRTPAAWQYALAIGMGGGLVVSWWLQWLYRGLIYRYQNIILRYREIVKELSA